MTMRFKITLRLSEDRDNLVLADWFEGGEELIEAAYCGSDTPGEADEPASHLPKTQRRRHRGHPEWGRLMRTPEQIDIEATEMATMHLDEVAANLGFQPDEDGISSEEAADRVLAHFREWLTWIKTSNSTSPDLASPPRSRQGREITA